MVNASYGHNAADKDGLYLQHSKLMQAYKAYLRMRAKIESVLQNNLTVGLLDHGPFGDCPICSRLERRS